jgi:hypothetical protein
MTRYRGYIIQHDEEGFYVATQGLGYCDTIEAIKSEIDDLIFEEQTRDPSFPPLDSPSLSSPWWAQK